MISRLLNTGNHTTLPQTHNHNKSPYLRILLGILLSLLSGVMLTVAFAPYNHWYLIFFAFIPYAFAQYRIMPKNLEALASAVMNSVWVGLYFGPMFIFTESAPWFMKALPLIAFGLAFLTDKGFRKLNDLTGYKWFVLHGISNWIFFEFIRTLIPGIATWGFLGYTLWNQTWLLFPLELVGIYGLNALILLINFTLAAILIHMVDNRLRLEEVVPIPLKTIRNTLLVTIALTLTWTITSLYLKDMRTNEINYNENIKVATIQHGETEVAFSHPDMNKENRVSLLVELTYEAAKQEPKIIGWPELAITFDPQEEYTQTFEELAQEINAYIAIPYGILANSEMRNEVKIVTPQGQWLPLYSKAHPVAFAGERRGPNWGSFPVHEEPEFNLASMICYDLNYTDVTRTLAKGGAQIIIAPSNDWPGIAQKQNIHLPFRAIENSIAIVKPESAFDSAIVSPLGEIIAQTESLTPMQEILVADVKLGTSKPTLYSQMGDIVGIALTIIAIAFMFVPGYAQSYADKK